LPKLMSVQSTSGRTRRSVKISSVQQQSDTTSHEDSRHHPERLCNYPPQAMFCSRFISFISFREKISC
jgi:hypothetical protein